MNFNLSNIITGEKIQSLADICLIDDYNPNANKFCKNSIKILNGKTKGNFIQLTEQQLNFLDKKIIYLPTHFLPYFFDNIFPFISNCELITHNSDHGILDHHSEKVNKQILNGLNSNKIKKWYSQNVTIYHQKLITLPIGIANSMWPHGNLELLKNIMDMKLERNKLYYFNFSINTRPDRRKPIYEQCIKNGLKFSPKTNQKEYLINLKQSKYCICPPGNGYDCHRIWECIYLGCIPILPDISAYQTFKNLPILFIKSWDIVTENFLEKSHKIGNNLEYSNFKYYQKLIQG